MAQKGHLKLAPAPDNALVAQEIDWLGTGSSASDWSLVQRSPTECDVSVCDHKASTMRRPWPTRCCGTMDVPL